MNISSKSLLFLLLLSICGCYENTTKKEINIFESELGLEKSRDLSKLIEYFDIKLQKKYNLKIVDAYRHHLVDIINSDNLSIEKWLPSQFKKDSIFNLYSKELIDDIWTRPDTVWIENNNLYQKLSFRETPSVRKIPDNQTNLDSIIYHSRYTEIFNGHGKYLAAFKKISGSNEIAHWYYNLKYDFDNIDPQIIAETLLESKIYLDDYLVKRIILIETFTEVVNELGKLE